MQGFVVPRERRPGCPSGIPPRERGWGSAAGRRSSPPAGDRGSGVWGRGFGGPGRRPQVGSTPEPRPPQGPPSLSDALTPPADRFLRCGR